MYKPVFGQAYGIGHLVWLGQVGNFHYVASNWQLLLHYGRAVTNFCYDVDEHLPHSYTMFYAVQLTSVSEASGLSAGLGWPH
jgi:hypothetical protein